MEVWYGAWTPGNRSFALIEGFQIPQEMQNTEEKDKRRMTCLDDFMRCPTDEEKLTWPNPGQLEELSPEEYNMLCQEDQCQRCIYRNNLTIAEVALIRL